ncbi:MAG: prolyl oligopeptidase family serine peptidase, partial [Aurantibacter sp.]
MEQLQKLLSDLKSSYKIDEDRIYVGGLSMGGMGTFEIVRRNPDTFAAAFAICGGAHPKTAGAVKDIPWWVFHGDEDMIVDYEHSQNMVEELKKMGADVKFTTYEGVNHDSWNNAFSEPELIPWLFSYSKQLYEQ